MHLQQAQQLVEQAQVLCREKNATLLYLTLFGSQLYGTDTPGKSDIDVRGIFLPCMEDAALGELPHSLHWSSGDNESRNAANDVDIDLWSVQHWLLKLLPVGDTGATDMLFSPSNTACTLFRDPRLDAVFDHPELLYDVKNCRAYADYSLGQAKKYGIKGSRLGALRSIHTWLLNNCPEPSHEIRLKDILPELAAACCDNKYCVIQELDGQPVLQLCGKIHVGNIRLREFVRRVIADMEHYGARAIAAEQNQGVDYKALSHALRAFDQMEELYATGKITFPLATREQLKAVKHGDIPWSELEDIIVRRLEETDAARERATCVSAYDSSFAKKQILSCYELRLPDAPQVKTDIFAEGFTVPQDALAAIHRRLRDIEKTHHVKVLYAAETGSRGWGFASRDSDYDVRFIYVHEPSWYMGESLCKHHDTIETEVENTPAGAFDVCGWDLEKALHLFRESNASIVEWLQSPIVYLEYGSLAARLRELLPTQGNLYRLWHHYNGMITSGLRRYEHSQTIKGYLYVLRPLIMLLWVEERLCPPPMRFDVAVHGVLVDSVIKDDIFAIVEQKKQGIEGDDYTPPQGVEHYVNAMVRKIRSCEDPRFAIPDNNVDYQRLFRDILKEIH